MFEINSKVEIEILGYFFLNQNARNYINELAKILECNPANLDKKLKELEEEGVLESKREGNQKYYFLNKKYPLLKEVKKIFEVKYGLREQLRKELNKVSNIKEAYIFGSFAKGKFKNKSDIDLLLVGAHSAIDVARVLSKIQKTRQREINTINMTQKDFLQKKKKHDEFLENIFDNQVIKVI